MSVQMVTNKIANIAKKDVDGWCKGVLKEVSRDNEGEFETLKFVFLVESTVETGLPLSILTGLTLNYDPIKIEKRGRGKKQEKKYYNKYTTLCLNMGLLSEDELVNKYSQQLVDRVGSSFSKLIDEKKCFRFKTIKDKRGYTVIDITTIKENTVQ